MSGNLLDAFERSLGEEQNRTTPPLDIDNELQTIHTKVQGITTLDKKKVAETIRETEVVLQKVLDNQQNLTPNHLKKLDELISDVKNITYTAQVNKWKFRDLFRNTSEITARNEKRVQEKLSSLNEVADKLRNRVMTLAESESETAQEPSEESESSEIGSAQQEHVTTPEELQSEEEAVENEMRRINEERVAVLVDLSSKRKLSPDEEYELSVLDEELNSSQEISSPQGYSPEVESIGESYAAPEHVTKTPEELQATKVGQIKTIYTSLEKGINEVEKLNVSKGFIAALKEILEKGTPREQLQLVKRLQTLPQESRKAEIETVYKNFTDRNPNFQVGLYDKDGGTRPEILVFMDEWPSIKQAQKDITAIRNNISTSSSEPRKTLEETLEMAMKFCTLSQLIGIKNGIEQLEPSLRNQLETILQRTEEGARVDALLSALGI